MDKEIKPHWVIDNPSLPLAEIPKKDITETPFRKQIKQMQQKNTLTKAFKKELLTKEKEFIHEYNGLTQEIYKNDEFDDQEKMEQQNVYWETLKYRETQYLQDMKIRLQKEKLQMLKNELSMLEQQKFDVEKPTDIQDYISKKPEMEKPKNTKKEKENIVKKKKVTKTTNKHNHGQLIGFFNRPKNKKQKTKQETVSETKKKSTVNENLHGFFDKKEKIGKGLYDDVKEAPMKELPKVIKDPNTNTAVHLEKDPNPNSLDSQYNKFIAEQKLNKIGQMMSGIEGINIERSGPGKISFSRKKDND